jgi:S-adenosyl methyltransferase
MRRRGGVTLYGERKRFRFRAADAAAERDGSSWLRLGPRVTEGTARLNQRMGPTQLTLRTRPDFERFFDGLEMVEPGIVPLPDWHGPGSEYPIPCYAGMGRKP